MKRFSILSILIVILATSCQTSSELGSTALIQKRRYTKGFNLNVKKPVVNRDDQLQSEANKTVLAESKNAVQLHEMQRSNFELETEKAAERKAASEELSKSLLNKEAKAEITEAVIAHPTQSEKAYPLKISNSNINNKWKKADSAEVNFHEVNVWTIIITILIPPLGVALILGIGTAFWISLVLTILFYIPGLIYSLIMILR